MLFVGRASLARKRIAAGHIGKKLQFPRKRHSRDRIAERAIRGGGLRNLRPVISRCATFRARAFCRASQLSSKKDCGGPYWKKALVSADCGASAKRGRLEICAILAPTSRARAFCRASQLNWKTDCGKRFWTITRPCPFFQGRSSQMARHPDLSCALQILYYPTQAVYQRPGKAARRPLYRS